MKRIAIISAIVLLAMATVPPVSAGELGLSYPYEMSDMRIGEGIQYTIEVGVHNRGNELMHIEMSAEGPIADYITFSPTEFDIDIEGSKRVTVSIAPLPEGIYGGLVSATQMISDSSGEGAVIHTGLSIGAPINVTAGDPPTEDDENVPPDDNLPEDDENIPPDDETPEENDNVPTDNVNNDNNPIPDDTDFSSTGGPDPLMIAAVAMVGIACVVVFIVPWLGKRREGDTVVTQ